MNNKLARSLPGSLLRENRVNARDRDLERKLIRRTKEICSLINSAEINFSRGRKRAIRIVLLIVYFLEL